MPAGDPNSPSHTDFSPLRTVTVLGNLALWGARLFFVVGLPGADVYPGRWFDHLLGFALLGVVVWQWRKLLAAEPELRPRLLLLIGWYFGLLLIPAVTAGFMRHTSLSLPASAMIFAVAFVQLLDTVPQPHRRSI